MSTPLIFTITDIGKAALWNAKNTGVELDLTHIQLGSANRIIAGDETALLLPQQSVEFAGGYKVSPSQIRMSAVFTGSSTYEIREIGMWAGDPALPASVLFAVWSKATGLLASKYPGVDFVFNHDMSISAAVPGESLNIIVSEQQAAFMQLISAHKSEAVPHEQYELRPALRKYLCGE